MKKKLYQALEVYEVQVGRPYCGGQTAYFVADDFDELVKMATGWASGLEGSPPITKVELLYNKVYSYLGEYER